MTKEEAFAIVNSDETFLRLKRAWSIVLQSMNGKYEYGCYYEDTTNTAEKLDYYLNEMNCFVLECFYKHEKFQDEIEYLLGECNELELAWKLKQWRAERKEQIA